jgi:polyribonucleotide nucleotidyltransferase
VCLAPLLTELLSFSPPQAAKSQSKVGVLLGLPQSSFGLIVGAKGATVMRLRQESGADIFVSRDDSGRIEITGDAESVQQAYESIIEVVESSSRREY